MDCEYGAKARGCYDVCDQMCSKAKQYRTDKNAEEKRKEEDAKEKRRRVYRAGVQRKAARLVKAIDAAGLADDTNLTFANYAADKTVGKIRAYANGDFGDDYFYGTDSLDPDTKHVPELCEKLKCSADYLLGLTDELTSVSKSDTLPWRTGTDYPDGKILFLFDDAGNLSYQVSEARHGRIRIYSDYDDGKIVRWLPLPPEEEGST